MPNGGVASIVGRIIHLATINVINVVSVDLERNPNENRTTHHPCPSPRRVLKFRLGGEAMKQLDEKGFVFVDGASRPFHVRMWNGEPWLFYWHPDKRWVSQRIVTQTEVWAFAKKRLPEEQAALYFSEEVKP